MDLNEVMERLVRIGPVAAMKEDERAAGFMPVCPGDVPWFSKYDWPDDVVVSVKGREVRIVAIKAKERGKGALRRLIGEIAYHGLTPIIVEPLFDMPDILKKWGWTSRIVGTGMNREEQWRPDEKWLRSRAISLG
jgi:hypothetical protein